MNVIKKKLPTIITLFLIGFVAYRQGPIWWKTYKQIGITLPSHLGVDLKTQDIIPEINENYILLYWASWCAPCKLEMQRLAHSVETKSIKADYILALNVFEDDITIEKFIEKNHYPFRFIRPSKELRQSVEVLATPSSFLVKDNRIIWANSGLSFIGIWIAELFLD